MSNKTLCEKTRELLARGARLIDVRSVEEFARGALRDAINIPLQQIGRAEQWLDKRQPLILYCASGRRSALAKRLLEQAGFAQVHDAGSIQALSQC